MPSRPFPFDFHVGTDLCKISRIVGVLKTRNARQFLQRWMTPREVLYFASSHGGAQVWNSFDADRFAQHLSGRWAAKEAVIKAVKPRKLTMREIEIWPGNKTKEHFAFVMDHPAPQFDDASYETALNRLETSAANQDAAAGSQPWCGPDPHTNGQIARLSISHESDYACAVAIAAPDSSGCPADASPPPNEPETLQPWRPSKMNKDLGARFVIRKHPK